MSEPVFGLTAAGIARTAETNRRVLGELPDTGRRTRRVFPQGGGGGGAEIVYFRILYFCYGFDASMGCACYEAEVTRTLCTSSVQIGDIITLRDPDRCWLNLPADLLFGRKGRATLFRTMDDRGGTHCTGQLRSRPTEDCIWIVDNLCCVEEDYAGV